MNYACFSSSIKLRGLKTSLCKSFYTNSRAIFLSSIFWFFVGGIFGGYSLKLFEIDVDKKNMKEFRCKFCNRLLAKVKEGSKVEIKCPKCKAMNLYDEEVVIIYDIPVNNVAKKIMERGFVDSRLGF